MKLLSCPFSSTISSIYFDKASEIGTITRLENYFIIGAFSSKKEKRKKKSDPPASFSVKGKVQKIDQVIIAILLNLMTSQK